MCIAAVVSFLASLPLPACASQLSPVMDKTGTIFVSDASSKFPDLIPVPVAILPFQTDKKLAKKKVGEAVSMILSQRLIRESKFKLLERARLDSVLKEQKLGMSGVIETETAVRAGNLAGARLLVMGNVSQIGKNYQITAKLVDTETSDIISVNIAEVPVETFDTEASGYLALVPDKQAISVYVAAEYAPAAGKQLAPETHLSQTITPVNPNGDMVGVGFGIRYEVRSAWMLDLGVVMGGIGPGNAAANVPNPGGGNSGIGNAVLNGIEVKTVLDRKFRLSKHFNWSLGAGVRAINFKHDQEGTQGNNGSGATYAVVEGDKLNYVSPLTRLGLEWKLQDRFRISLLGAYSFKAVHHKLVFDIKNGGSTERMTLWDTQFPQLSGELNIAWYF